MEAGGEASSNPAPGAIKYTESFLTNSRGVRLCTSSWIPEQGPVSGVILLCHGFTLNCSTYFQSTAEALANAGFAVHGLDYEGHGKSEGQRGLVWGIDRLADDCLEYFGPIREQEQYKGKHMFLVGESLGGAVAQLIAGREPNRWDGAVLLATVHAGVAEDVQRGLPLPMLLPVVLALSSLFPTWAVGPPINLPERGIKDPQKREAFKLDSYVYQGLVPLQCGRAFVEGGKMLQDNTPKITTPMLLLHGTDDKVVDYQGTEQLFKDISSSDKEIKLYPGMWHLLTEGASAEDFRVVFKDIVQWLQKRSTG